MAKRIIGLGKKKSLYIVERARKENRRKWNQGKPWALNRDPPESGLITLEYILPRGKSRRSNKNNLYNQEGISSRSEKKALFCRE